MAHPGPSRQPAAYAADVDPSLERQALLSDSLEYGAASSSPLRGPSPQTFVAGEVPFWKRPLVITAAKNVSLILLWYFFGTFLSLWNKLLLGKEHGLFGKGAFPAPFLMSALQFLCQHVIARVLLWLGLGKRRTDGPRSWKDYIKTVVPNGIATGLDIGFSNFSLVFITLSFYVMCKSTTPLFLLMFAIIWGLEKPSWSLAGVVSVITAGLLLLVAGETRFDLLGFVLVMSAAALAGLRWTITQVLLQGTNGHSSSGGPVEVILQLTPIMSLTLLIISVAFEKLWITLPPSPYFSGFEHTMVTVFIIIVGGVIAFSMVWAEYTLISNTSALTFMVAGTFKEIVTVGAAVFYLHEPFTIVNAMGLVVLLLGVILFNWMKYQKLRQGEIKALPVSYEDGRKHSEADVGGLASESLHGGSHNGRESVLELSGAVDTYTNGNHTSNNNNNNNNHFRHQQSSAVSSGVPMAAGGGTHLTEASLRRAFVLHEAEDGSAPASPTDVAALPVVAR